jgi:hypothetical protein
MEKRQIDNAEMPHLGDSRRGVADEANDSGRISSPLTQGTSAS